MLLCVVVGGRDDVGIKSDGSGVVHRPLCVYDFVGVVTSCHQV